jgi:effector-binding domain-containing protein
MDKVEQIGLNWDKFVQSVEEEPHELIGLGIEGMKRVILKNLEPLARFLGMKAISFEWGKWYARMERIDLDEDESELSIIKDKELYVSLEDENGCSVVVLAIREDDSGEVDVFTRSSGEVLEIVFSGRICESQDVPWDDDPW